ncbi:MAG: TonB-dependent receptor [Paludibacter sp.]|nr:TonB-dependent receptor [Paludibacter sp.]
MDHKKNQERKYVSLAFRNSVCTLVFFLSFSWLCPTSVLAQDNVLPKTTVKEITVKGKVTDASNIPVIGASILVVGTKSGTITDIDGNFSVKAPSNALLAVSYIGYIPQKVKVSESTLSVVLEEDAAKLDEVVVVGYGSVKRANLTGAVSSISMKQVADIPSPNLSSVLMGTMPGVNVNEATGNPIGNASISIRINGSWNAEDPLYVIDGFIRDVDAFNLLDASEVENISVLKDAAASIYGVRGAGGVILVTTKKGKAGKTKISYSGSFGTNQGVDMPVMMSAYQQGIALNDLWRQEILYKGADSTKYKMFTQDELQKMKSLNYNWMDNAWKDAVNTRHTLNVSGGNEDVRYFIGGSYMFANGNFSNLNMNRFGVRAGVDAKLAKNLTGSFSLDYSSKSTEMPLSTKDAEPERMYGTFSDLIRAPRYIPAYINGVPVGNSIPSNGTHPLEMMNSGSYRRNRSDNIVGGMNLVYNIEQIKGLKVSASLNYSSQSSSGKQLSKTYYVYNFAYDGNTHLLTDQQLPITDTKFRTKITNGDKLFESADFSYAYQFNPQISYANKFGNHDISAMLMYEQSEDGGHGLTANRTGMVIDNYEVMAGYSEAGMGNSSSINTINRRQSFISRFNYNFADKYFVEGAARYEASTNFAPGYRWGLFPSIALGWRISEEKFFKDNIRFIEDMKFRASYGRLGNDKVSMGQWRASYSNSSGAYIGGTSLSTVLYPDMEGLIYTQSTWEKSDSYNGGVDIHFLNNFALNFDGFYRYTFDILDDFKSQFPQSSGIVASTPKLNSGIQDSWGGEIEISYNRTINKDWSVQLKGNIAYATNKVIKKSENPGVIGTWQDEIGRIRGGEVGYFSTGIARTQADVDNYIQYLQSHTSTGTGPVTVLGLRSSYTDAQGNVKTDFYPGMLMFKDVGSPAYKDENGKWHDGAPDGSITTDDQRIISKYDSAPFNYGFSFGFTWKNLKVDALLNGAFGNDVVFDKGFYTAASGGQRTGDFLSEQSNQLAEWSGNYWTVDNVNAKYPRLDSYSLRDQRSTFWLRDGHTLRLRSVNVSYSLPAKVAKFIAVDQFRVFFSGSNLWTIINPYSYKDASVGYWSDYPMIRTFNFGVNLNF